MAWQDRDYNREGPARIGPGSITLWLILITAIVFLADRVLLGSSRAGLAAPGPWLYFSVDRGIEHWQLWRWFSYPLIHLGWLDIIFSMLWLYFFGPTVEQSLGPRRFLAFYFLCGVVGAGVFALFSLWPQIIHVDQYSPLVGAWACVFGVLVGCAVVDPRMPVSLFPFPITFTMRTMAIGAMVISVAMVAVGSVGAGTEVASLGGAGLGYVLSRWPWLLNFADRLSFGFVARARGAARRASQAAAARRDEEQTAEVDRILEKVRLHGMQSLSRADKRALQRATERQRLGG